MSRWTPKFPDIARDLRDRKLNEAERETDEAREEWVDAPETSHVHSFLLVDARKDRVAKIGGFSYVYVRFKDRDTGAVASRYTYSFPDARDAARWFDKLASADHPGVVINEMIAAGVLYEKVY